MKGERLLPRAWGTLIKERAVFTASTVQNRRAPMPSVDSGVLNQRSRPADVGCQVQFKPQVWFTRLWQRIQRWRRVAYERRLLASMDHSALKDIGLSRADALRESQRPFWDERPGE
ncbi:hypothetical protein C2846_15645 [Pseudomonas jilinensis]|uniref:YjiS-like domain-containing protein n=2 Tax=Pseudomonas jilinensis TaxID=2078689 RepID=A0A396RZX5_9PSED|nr:hypothetical protein C2846_15645 [Pseudomonas jilinensis]